jgi:hypothetical protein
MSSSEFVSLLFDIHRATEPTAKSSYYPTVKEKKKDTKRHMRTSDAQPVSVCRPQRAMIRFLLQLVLIKKHLVLSLNSIPSIDLFYMCFAFYLLSVQN